jgi:hypothetical protein
VIVLMGGKKIFFGAGVINGLPKDLKVVVHER